MNSYEIFRRLRAYQEAKPVPKGATIHFPVAKDADLLKLAFIRMGGESAPWGIAYRLGQGDLKIETVPEPRNREQVADMVVTIAPVLLKHLFHQMHSPGTAQGPESALSHRQIWLPNASHLDMLHMLAYAYSFTRRWPSHQRQLLNAFGRACGWLFREAQRPGQVRVMDAAAALRNSYSFPSDDVRQQHTGYLLAWLQAQGKREAKWASTAAAEKLTVAMSLDPAFERDQLQPANEEYNEARRAGNQRKQRKFVKVIHDRLTQELRRRIELIENTIEVMRADSRRTNAGVAGLEKLSHEEHWYQYLRVEQNLIDDIDGPAFSPSPETDHQPAAAASRYHVHEASESLRFNALLDDDIELQAEAAAEGKVVQGTVAEVRDEAEGRSTCPVWLVEDKFDLPLRYRVGDRLCVASLRNRWGVIRSLDNLPAGGHMIEIEIRGLKTRPRGVDGQSVPLATDSSLVGQRVTLLPTSGESVSRTKSMRTWKRDTPGAWLTHRSPNRGGSSPEIGSEEESA